MKTIFALLLSLSPMTSWATETYQCEAILASSALVEGGVTWPFSPNNANESHGGAPLTFREGVHEIQVLATKQWLGISWMKEGKKIAEGVFVLGGEDQAAQRVAILYDPSDSGDQVSLGCKLAL